jgi:ketosteroid isomerase-like protein
MFRYIYGTLPVIVVFLLVSSASAQQWSPEQQDVWKGVQTYWEAGMSGNASDFLSYFDDSYLGWSYSSQAPGTKADASKSLNYWLPKGKVAYYTLTPAKIWVNGDFAYVHYYYTQVTEMDGKPTSEKGRWTDILMKKNGKWMMVGDHGGEIKSGN